MTFLFTFLGYFNFFLVHSWITINKFYNDIWWQKAWKKKVLISHYLGKASHPARIDRRQIWTKKPKSVLVFKPGLLRKNAILLYCLANTTIVWPNLIASKQNLTCSSQKCTYPEPSNSNSITELEAATDEPKIPQKIAKTRNNPRNIFAFEIFSLTC